jgi:hypothetical protein
MPVVDPAVTMALLVTIWRIPEDAGDVVESGGDRLVPVEGSPT